MAGGLVLAALAGLLMPSARRLRPAAGQRERASSGMLGGEAAAGSSSP